MDDRPLTDILKAAEVAPPTQALQKLADDTAALVGYAPPAEDVKNAPAHGAAAHRNISIYGQALAQFLEEQAQGAIREAEAYADNCRELADKVRSMAATEADRAIRYTKRVRRIATMLEEASQLHDEDV